MRTSPESYRKAMDVQIKLHEMYKGTPRLEAKAGIQTAGLNPMLIKEAERLEQANKERRPWKTVKQDIQFNYSRIRS